MGGGGFRKGGKSHFPSGARVVIHCRAGHTQTGVMIYLILRWAFDYSPDKATTAMEEMRPEMHQEFFRHRRGGRGDLHSKAEEIFVTASGSSASWRRLISSRLASS